MNILIDAKLKELYPHIQLGCLVFDAEVQQINEDLWKEVNEKTIPELMKVMEETSVIDIKNITESRQAYRAFGKDPGRYRVSSEALYRRIKQGKGLYKINTVVDVNNLISLETGFSVGSYDLEKLKGDITLSIGEEGQSYKGIGKDDINVASLPVLCDEEGPFGSPTSDSTKAMITLETKKIVMIVYNFSEFVDINKVLDRGIEQLKTFAKVENIEKIII